MKKTISIVLPVYNGAKYVGRAIESILEQTYDEFEIVAVNDCSTDNTLEVLKEYTKKDSRIKVFSNESNKKLPKTLNEGFEHASGEYLTWTSDDNVYHKEALEKMVQILDEKPEIDLVYADFNIVDMEGKILEVITEDEPNEIRYKDNIGACFLYRKSLAERVGGYDPEMFLAEDYDFFIRCHKEAKGAFFHLKENLYDYGRHEASLTSTRKTEIAHKAYEVMMKHFEYLYSLCKTNKERIKFFDELLTLLFDSAERDLQRRCFCENYSFYRTCEMGRKIKRRMNRIMQKLAQRTSKC